MGIIRFTSASAKDAESRVTVTPNKLFNVFKHNFTYNELVDLAQKVLVKIKHENKTYDVFFYRNRLGSSGSFKTTS